MSSLSTEADNWCEEQLFDQAESYFDKLINSIDNATYTINLEFYIFNYDRVGKRVISALSSAIQRGVTVKVLIDGIGSSDSGTEAAEQLEAVGAEVKIYHPLPWKLSHYPRSLITGNLLYKFFLFFQNINNRDHKKSCIIDSAFLWTGSLNISSQHLSKENDGEGWRDYGVFVEGYGVRDIEDSFYRQWNKADLKTEPTSLKGQFKLFRDSINRHARRKNYLRLLRHIKNSKHRIWVSSAYFAPSSKVLRALKAASKRGVDVRILVPRCSDVALFPYLTITYYHGLVHAGIRIFEYLPSFLHAKAVIIDDLYLVGSSNFNHRSSLHDLELDIALTHTSTQNQLEHIFNQDMQNSHEIMHDKIPYTLKHIFLGYSARAIRYWM